MLLPLVLRPALDGCLCSRHQADHDGHFQSRDILQSHLPYPRLDAFQRPSQSLSASPLQLPLPALLSQRAKACTSLCYAEWQGAAEAKPCPYIPPPPRPPRVGKGAHFSPLLSSPPATAVSSGKFPLKGSSSPDRMINGGAGILKRACTRPCCKDVCFASSTPRAGKGLAVLLWPRQWEKV